ncbi:hypothetical protein, partial [Pseudomonas extremaustralis]|uniref:hypothetical protein n=1 Tax=Pseudomonas extremaustralis TaxID=359110 RepID=UPI0023078CB0
HWNKVSEPAAPTRYRYSAIWGQPRSLPKSAMGSSLRIMVTKRAGQIECKRVLKWIAVFQLVFQPKIKIDINVINQ